MVGRSKIAISTREQYLDIVRQELKAFERQELERRADERRERLARLLGKSGRDSTPQS
jgi:hypothetical protein